MGLTDKETRFVLTAIGVLITVLAMYLFVFRTDQIKEEGLFSLDVETETEGSPVNEKEVSMVSATPWAGNVPTEVREEYEIITLLPKDAIPAIDSPQFYTAEEAETEYMPNEKVLGVSINGESRAYSTSLLDRHEIVNDEVGGTKIAVTW